MEGHPKVTDVKELAIYPKQREIWCVFVYEPEIEDIDSKLEMWTIFWEGICRRREMFYSDFKKPGLGYITVYPLFISKEKLQELLKEEKSAFS